MNARTDGPVTLADVAGWFLAINDDLVGPEDDLDPAVEADALEIIRREYASGSCGAYAIALHDATGLQIVAVNGGFHYAVAAPNGRLIDHHGIATTAEVATRYGMINPPITPATRDEVLADALYADEDADDPWSAVALATWTLAHRGIPEHD